MTEKQTKNTIGLRAKIGVCFASYLLFIKETILEWSIFFSRDRASFVPLTI
jgi:ABC-type polar amino acid transport system ATPase subunit